MSIKILEEIRERAMDAIEKAVSPDVIEEIRIQYFGKKGELTTILRTMGSLSAEERPTFGAAVNSAKEELVALLESKVQKLGEAKLAMKYRKEKIDVSLPGRKGELGNIHPITWGFDEIASIFVNLGFSIVEGPEVETVHYNFDALNTPENHPARDPQDTFFVTDSILLRTQTSPMQVRTMEKVKPPVKVIVPGKVYRRDQVDATHSPLFHQCEGLYVDEGITFAHLKGVLTEFAMTFYGRDRKVRFRPHYFPFTEPSAEMDVSCMICSGAGCRVCKNEGWIEILGAGMVHPNVLKAAGYDDPKLSGFAFGLGVDRIVMLKYGMEDLRLMFENDLRFLRQF